MNTEIEAKFLDVDFDELRTKLKELGAYCEQPMRLMRRVSIRNEFMATGKDSFVRIRDEGDKVTLTYKQFDQLSVDGAKEIGVTVGDFEKTIEIFKQAGLPYNSYQESRRETWKLDETEIVLDEWPWLKPYVEIESPSEETLKDFAVKLGFNWDQAVFGDVMAAYRAQYSHLTLKDTVAHIPEVKFDDPLPDLLKN